MKLQSLKLCFLIIGTILITSCGGGDTLGGTGQFKTVVVSAAAEKNLLDSDVISGNKCDGVSTEGGIKPDTVNVVISSAAYPKISVTPSPVFVDRVTVTFTPNNSKSTSPPPPLPPIYSTSIGQVIEPGASLSLPVEVAPRALKSSLLFDFNFPECGGVDWSYYVTIALDVVEQSTGTRLQLKTSLDVTFADTIGT